MANARSKFPGMRHVETGPDWKRRVELRWLQHFVVGYSHKKKDTKRISPVSCPSKFLCYAGKADRLTRLFGFFGLKAFGKRLVGEDHFELCGLVGFVVLAEAIFTAEAWSVIAFRVLFHGLAGEWTSDLLELTGCEQLLICFRGELFRVGFERLGAVRAAEVDVTFFMVNVVIRRDGLLRNWALDALQLGSISGVGDESHAESDCQSEKSLSHSVSFLKRSLD